jgi:hypothetical protein
VRIASHSSSILPTRKNGVYATCIHILWSPGVAFLAFWSRRRSSLPHNRISLRLTILHSPGSGCIPRYAVIPLRSLGALTQELQTIFCACGKEEVEQPTETCRWCGRVTGYCFGRDVHHLKRIREQLGSATDLERRDDPVLSQLG